MDDTKEKVILVDENDKEIGTEDKLKAHRGAKLHRGFSVYIFNSKGQQLLQQRAKTKYHSGGAWLNACCGHPRPNEDVKDAAERRLNEEMGLKCELKEIFSVIYKCEVGSNMHEHEFLHIFLGKSDETPNPDKNEVMAWKLVGVAELLHDLKENPEKYTYWFRLVMGKIPNI